MTLLVTGGAGFIGSAFVRLCLHAEPGLKIVNLDKLTYAGNLRNLESVEAMPNYSFHRGDIGDRDLVTRLLNEYKPDAIVHFAAESHVDRSILGADVFFETNLRGTFNLLECARTFGIGRFVHVSTDEVYGSIDEPYHADENYPLRPSSPYSASKAGSDLLALSYFTTYKIPVVVTRASNNYGPYQFPEKLIPLMITNALADKALPVYGDGMQIRDWLFVDDHCRAILAVLRKGRAGEIYNISGCHSAPNRAVIDTILSIAGKPSSLITTVADRPGHDRRYALTSEKLSAETGWQAEVGFADGIELTVRWYRENSEWTRSVHSREYLEYYDRNYKERLSVAHIA